MVPDLTFVVQIRLVRHDDNGEEVPVLDAQDLLMELRAANRRGEKFSARSVTRTRSKSDVAAHISSKLLRLVMLYTRRKPSPVRMYCSLIALYSSCPAVSRTSKSATSSSITHCLR